MSGSLHDRAGEVFIEARRLSGPAREEFVKQRCGADGALLAEVRSLLAHDAGCAPIDEPVAASRIARALAPERSPAEPEIPGRVGRFTILGVLGEGGMGVVYRAAQESPRRVVALKLIRAGSRRPALLRRFEREAEALARLQHPGIAQVFEVGQAPGESGACPYLAMELVDGLPITEFVRRQGLDLTRKLQLLARVADAVHHAHTKGVIHRDLKPGNILAFDDGGAASRAPGAGPGTATSSSRDPGATGVKILDFGVARLLDDPEATSVTDPGQLVGTIRYMSPEQLGGDAHAADARSDVYALGLIAYEMLAGVPPHPTQGLPLAEVTRRIREDEPTPLSRHDRGLAGDPEIIIAKALEKDPARRYASAAEFADDVRRCLADEPIGARPPSVGYQLVKFARRNRGLVGVGVTALAALVTVAVVSSVAYVVASGERDAARKARDDEAAALAQETAARLSAAREAEKSLRALEFLRTMLSSADPSRADAEVTVATVLDRASAAADAAFDGQPESEAAIRYTLGTAYRALGRDEPARRELERAVALRAGALGASHLDTDAARLALADVLVHSRRPDEAEQLVQELLQRHAPESGDPMTPRLLNLLGQAHLLRSRFGEAEGVLRHAVELGAPAGLTAADIASYRANLGMALEMGGKLVEAERELAAAGEELEKVWGPRHNLTLTARAQVATVRARLGRGQESIPELERLVEIRREAFGEDHPATLTLTSNLGNAYLNLKQFDKAAPLLQRAGEGLERSLGPDDERSITALNNLASVYLLQGMHREAEPMYRRVLESQRRVLGATHQKTLSTTNNLGKCLHKLGKLDEAESVYAGLVTTAKESLPSGHWMVGAFKLGWGQVLTDLERYEQAEAPLVEALATLSAKLGPSHDYAAVARKNLRALYVAWKKPEKAAAIVDPPPPP